MTRSPPKLALPWILEEDWPSWQEVDRGVPSYAKWVELFEKNLKLAEACGWPYERISVRPAPFTDWCKANQRPVGKFDRSLYALELLRKGNGTQPAGVEITPSPAAAVVASDDATNPIEAVVDVNPGQPVADTPASELAVNAPAP